jgi:hypothetical protein
MISKVELKKQLQAMGIKVEKGHVKKCDIKKILASDTLVEDSKKAASDLIKFLDSFKNYGHQLELLGKSDELMKLDDARSAIKSMVDRANSFFKEKK